MERFDLSEWQSQTTESLIDCIQTQFHNNLREKLPPILALFEKVASRHGATFPELHDALVLYRQFSQKIPLHLLKEEQILFPLLLAQEKSASSNKSSLPDVQLAHPIMALEVEHEEDREIFSDIQRLLKDFNPPEGACSSYRLLLESLRAIKTEFFLHVAIENEILFKRFQTDLES